MLAPPAEGAAPLNLLDTYQYQRRAVGAAAQQAAIDAARYAAVEHAVQRSAHYEATEAHTWRRGSRWSWWLRLQEMVALHRT